MARIQGRQTFKHPVAIRQLGVELFEVFELETQIYFLGLSLFCNNLGENVLGWGCGTWSVLVKANILFLNETVRSGDPEVSGLNLKLKDQKRHQQADLGLPCNFSPKSKAEEASAG